MKFYLCNSNLVVRILHEDEIGNATCIGSLYPVVTDSLYSFIGVGAIVLSMQKGRPRPELRIRQDTILTPFLCPIANVSMEDEKHKTILKEQA